MKKSLIALAIAGTFAAPAFAASANVDFYGKFRISLNNANHGNDWSMTDEVSRVGFKGAEDLGGGLKAIYQYETGFAINSTAALGSRRNTFLGLAGDFGTVLAGRHDTPYKLAGSADLFGDTAADAQGGAGSTGGATCIIGCQNFDLRVDNAIAYVSPSFSGLTLIAAIVPGSGTNAIDTNPNANSLTDAYSLAAKYGNGPLEASLAYEDHNNLADESAWKLNVGYTMGDLKLGGTYEDQKDLGGVAGNDAKAYLVSAAYGMGPITLAAQFGKRNPDGANNNMTDIAVGVVYGLSKRTSTYLGYCNAKPEGVSAYNVITVGLNHDF